MYDKINILGSSITVFKKLNSTMSVSGKVKHELQDASYEFKYTNYEVKSTCYEFKSTSYESKSTS